MNNFCSMRYFYKNFIVVIFFFCSAASYATHLKGGEIRVTHISNLTYKATALVYFDAGSAMTNAEPELMMCMGDGQVIKATRQSLNTLPGVASTSIGIYEATYTYPASGRYQISASIDNRNTGILNFPNSELSPMFLWTIFDTSLGNSTPASPDLQFTGGVRQLFTQDLKVTDVNGDSVSFHLQKLSRAFPGTCGIRSTDQSYIYPNEVNKSGTLKIDQVTKKLIWNAPAQAGYYSIAYVVDEWRNGIIISQTYREGLITVSDKPGETVDIPAFEYPADNGVVTALPYLESPEISIAVEAYPVPTDDFVNVKAYSKSRSVITLQLIDMQGRILQQIKSRSAEILIQEQFDLRDYPKGMYLIRAENDMESVTQKILR